MSAIVELFGHSVAAQGEDWRQNELHLVPEVTIPGGNVDYFLVSAKSGKVKDFVGIEIQTIDTTGTIWPERQRLLRKFEAANDETGETSKKSYGLNWKMTAKTTLVQMHHKVPTFEHLNKKLVLIVQYKLLTYMARQFRFGHVKNPAVIGDSMHIHAYRMENQSGGSLKPVMQSRLSTDAEGIGVCLGLRAEARIELEAILQSLQTKLSSATLFIPHL